VQAPRKRRKLPGTLEADQVGAYLAGDGSDDPLQLRDMAMAELFYSSGLRLAELRGSTSTDIDRGQRLMTVTGKGNKTRSVPVGSAALAAIDAWLAAAPADRRAAEENACL
jgi:integrase/recombinase XerC